MGSQPTTAELMERNKALAADRDQISLTLAVAKADRDKWFNRARDLEAFVKRVANSDMTEGAPAYVVEARKLLRSAEAAHGQYVKAFDCDTLAAALRYVEFYMIDVSFPKDHHALLAVQKALKTGAFTAETEGK